MHVLHFYDRLQSSKIYVKLSSSETQSYLHGSVLVWVGGVVQDEPLIQHMQQLHGHLVYGDTRAARVQ